jgi:hypothetical protein
LAIPKHRGTLEQKPSRLSVRVNGSFDRQSKRRHTLNFINDDRAIHSGDETRWICLRRGQRRGIIQREIFGGVAFGGKRVEQACFCRCAWLPE